MARSEQVIELPGDFEIKLFRFFTLQAVRLHDVFEHERFVAV